MNALYIAASWSPTTYVLLFTGMVLCILAVFVTFVMVLVRAARAEDPPRPTATPDAGDDQGATVTHLHRRHPHAA